MEALSVRNVLPSFRFWKDRGDRSLAGVAGRGIGFAPARTVVCLAGRNGRSAAGDIHCARSLYAIYLALPAFYLFAASSLLLLRDLALRAAAVISTLFQVQVRQLALFLLVALALAPIHYRQKTLVTRPWVESDPLRVLDEYLTAKYPSMPRNASILFPSDPLPPGDWALVMFIRLHYQDQGIRVDRVNSMASVPDAAKQKEYLHVFTLTGREIEETTP